VTTASAVEEVPLCLPPRPLTRAPLAALPAGTVDCHFHVFDRGARLAPMRSYTPQIAGLDDWQRLASAIGIAAGVLVQPSVYGFDNSVLLGALDAASDKLRGIVVLPPETTQRELEALHARGARGLRCNTRNLSGLTLTAAARLAARFAHLDWILQLQVGPAEFDLLPALIAKMNVRIVLDHFGFVDPRDRITSLRQLRALLDTGRVYAKLSAAYRLAGSREEIAALVTALTSSHPDRLLWGTDWPHTELWHDVPDDADLVDEALGWFASEAVRHRIFVETPRSLFFS
jgi:predicted TIM-barrel fold metal-dependent hydrolase